jgi:hypothetical protein
MILQNHFCIVPGDTVCCFVTNRSGVPIFTVKIAAVETATAHAINVTNSKVV